MPAVRVAKGDTVIHAGKPEWGPGDVLSVEGVLHEGKSVQRVTIRFARAGLKTISTAFAELRQVKNGTPLTAPTPSPQPRTKHAPEPTEPVQDDAPDPSRQAAAEALQKLPDEATDPFLPLTQRVRTTLALYRYADSPGGLMDWAVTQTALRDPLAHFSRHDLEAAFERFRIALDNHLRKVVPAARKASPRDVEAMLAAAGPAARQAVRRVDIGR